MASKYMPLVDWLKIESSAPGKFIISGEYSVVYEKQAIASAIDLRTNVTICPNNEGKVRLKLKNLNNTRAWSTSSLTMCRLVSKYTECLDYDGTMPVKLNHLLHSRYFENPTVTDSQDGDSRMSQKDMEKKSDDAAMAFLLLYVSLGDSYASAARPSIDVEVDSTIPVGSGLGSSSAYAVALCGALMRVYRVSAEKYIISNWAFNIDKFFHGRPSGVDNNVITHGGYILFQNGKIKQCGTQHKAPIKVMLIDTCVSRSTRELTESVARLYRDDQTKVNSIFRNINELTSQIWRKMDDPNFAPKNISPFLQANQELLDALGVGHEKLSLICNLAIEHNLTAKQTGAGGGGFAFVLYDDSDNCSHIAQLRSELKTRGFQIHDYRIGCEGLVVTTKLDPTKQTLRI